jgi:hypothetical protein
MYVFRTWQLKGLSMETTDYHENPPGLILTKQTIDHLLKQEKPDQLLALYTFYCYTALWQHTSSVWATTKYAASAMGWARGKLQRVKKRLVDLGYVEDVQERKEGSGCFDKRYIRVRYYTTKRVKRTEKPVRQNTVRRKTGCTVKARAKCLYTGNSICLGSGRFFSDEKNDGGKRRRVGGEEILLLGKKNQNSKHTTFALRWGAKIQSALNIHAKVAHKKRVIHKKVTSTTWAKQVEYILHTMRVDRGLFKTVMSWYLKKGYKQPKVPRIFRVADLVEKWPALADAYARLQASADTGIRYRQGADGAWGFYDDSASEEL